jgi:hypothetical protein
MPALETILDAMAGWYAEACGLTGYGYVEPAPVVPCVMTVPVTVRYDPAGRGAGWGPGTDDVWQVELWLLLARVEDKVDQRLLYELVDGAGPRSIRRATIHARSIRGDMYGLRNVKARLLGTDSLGARFTAAGLSHVGAVLRLEVITAANDDEPPQPPD